MDPPASYIDGYGCLTNEIPSSFAGTPSTPETRSIIAVAEQIRIVSINTETTCTIPCLAGWETEALAAAFGALPIPASFEKVPS